MPALWEILIKGAEKALQEQGENVVSKYATKVVENAEAKAKDFRVPLDESFLAKTLRSIKQGFHSKTWYHGTPAENITEFTPSRDGLYGPGIYMTENPELASKYAQKYGNPTTYSGSHLRPTVMPLRTRVENPIDMDTVADPEKWRKSFIKSVYDNYGDYVGDNLIPHNPSGFLDEMKKFRVAALAETPEHAAELMKKNEFTNKEMYLSLRQAMSEWGLPWQGSEHGEVLQYAMRDMGHDALTHLGGGIMGDTRHQVLVVFDPAAIRSPFANFDPKKRYSTNILAGGAATAIGISQLPKLGQIEDGYRFLGGDPGDQKNWKKVK